jgi:hypothetical protein
MNRTSKILLTIIVLYNIGLGIYVITQTRRPVLAILFIVANIFFIVYYIIQIMVGRYKVYKFNKEHGDLVKQAMAELSKGRETKI